MSLGEKFDDAPERDPYLRLLAAARATLDQALYSRRAPCALCGQLPHDPRCAVLQLEAALPSQKGDTLDPHP